MKTITTRIPEEYERILEEMEREEKIPRSEALRRLISKSLREWRTEKALKMLSEHKITIREASKIANVTYPEMLDLASKNEITVGYDMSELERDLKGL